MAGLVASSIGRGNDATQVAYLTALEQVTSPSRRGQHGALVTAHGESGVAVERLPPDRSQGGHHLVGVAAVGDLDDDVTWRTLSDEA